MRRRSSAGGGEVTKVVVAGQALEVGDVVSRQNVVERDWVSDLVPKGSVSLDEVVGRQVTVPASEGSPVTQLNFREAATSVDVPDGYVAASVPLGEKLGLPSDIGVGTRVVAFRVGESGARVLSDDVQAISSPGRAVRWSASQRHVRWRCGRRPWRSSRHRGRRGLPAPDCAGGGRVGERTPTGPHRGDGRGPCGFRREGEARTMSDACEWVGYWHR